MNISCLSTASILGAVEVTLVHPLWLHDMEDLVHKISTHSHVCVSTLFHVVYNTVFQMRPYLKG